MLWLPYWARLQAEKAPLASPAFTGTPTAPTAAVDTNTTQIATTAFVIGQGYLKSSVAASTYAPIAGPTFTGLVTLSGGQLKFPATQIPSTDANTLDDYKEFPPTAAAVIPQSGAFGSVSGSVNYTKIGNRISLTATITITTNGTASGIIEVNIPVIPPETTPASIVRTDGVLLSGFAFNNGGQGQILISGKYDGTYPGADGKVIVAQCTFRV